MKRLRRFSPFKRKSLKMKQIFIVSVILLWSAVFTVQAQPSQLTIIHSNDLHSHLLGAPANLDYTPEATGDDQTLGGWARIATVIKNVKQDRSNPVLVLDGSGRGPVRNVAPMSVVAPGYAPAGRHLVAAAVRRVGHHDPLEMRRQGVKQSALVVGGGIAGIEAALRLADAGKQVYLVEREPSIGGHMAQLYKTFPTLDCASCITTPKMAAAAHHAASGAYRAGRDGCRGCLAARWRAEPGGADRGVDIADGDIRQPASHFLAILPRFDREHTGNIGVAVTRDDVFVAAPSLRIFEGPVEKPAIELPCGSQVFRDQVVPDHLARQRLLRKRHASQVRLAYRRAGRDACEQGCSDECSF